MILVIVWITGSFIVAGELVSSIILRDLGYILFSGILYMLYAFQVGWFARRCGNFNWILFLGYPILFLFFAGVFAYSLFRVHVLGSVQWKGRKIDV
ncbi:MAG: hypothetical protein L0K82_03615 [Pisciglobus halotolerans]|nr:hypothetical protein [Pisciglobus halotolerans]